MYSVTSITCQVNANHAAMKPPAIAKAVIKRTTPAIVPFDQATLKGSPDDGPYRIPALWQFITNP